MAFLVTIETFGRCDPKLLTFLLAVFGGVAHL